MFNQEIASLQTSHGEPVMLNGVHISGDLRGQLFEARVEQRFSNPTDKNMEVVYTFPLPWGAVLLGVNVQLGDKQLSGSVIEKKKAETQYEEALSEGNAAIMLEKNRDNSFCLNLGNLAPKENCIITLSYAQTLQFEQKGLRLLIPTVIAPRFGDAVKDGGLQPHQAPVNSLEVEYPFNINLHLYGDLARARIASPSHPVGIAHNQNEGEDRVLVTLGRTASLDRDFVLVVDQLAQESIAVLAKDMAESDLVVALAIICPQIPAQTKTSAAIKMLVDCSGSMSGDSIEAAKRAMQAIVSHMEKGDKFSLSKFGSTVEHRSRGLWSVTETTQLAARRWVNDVDANLGGTKMEGALESTFKLAKENTSDVLLITDGEINAIDSTIKSAQASGHRVFAVGIGSSPAESHLRRLALATGGACDFVAPGEAVEPAVLRMFNRLRSPRLNDLAIIWPEGNKPEWVSELPRSIFYGDTVHVYARLKSVPQGAIQLMGHEPNNGTPIQIASVDLSQSVLETDTLSRMAASCQMEELNTANPEQAQKLAVTYQLVSEQTNFLLVQAREEAQKAKDMPELHKVKQMMPAGWGGIGSVATGHSYSPAFRVSDNGKFSIADSSDIMFSRGMPDEPADPTAMKRIRRKIRKILKGVPKEENPVVKELPNKFSGTQPHDVFGWLSNAPYEQWPTSLAKLQEMGLDLYIVEWLELAVLPRVASKFSEREVVLAFLIALEKEVPSHELVKQTGKAKLSPKQVAELQPLVDDFQATLSGISPSEWPDEIYSLDVDLD